MVKGSAAFTPGTIASGASANVTVTVTGAALGMVAAAAFSLALPAGVMISAAVTALNTVVVTMANLSGGPVTLGVGTATAEVLTS